MQTNYIQTRSKAQLISALAAVPFDREVPTVIEAVDTNGRLLCKYTIKTPEVISHKMRGRHQMTEDEWHEKRLRRIIAQVRKTSAALWNPPTLI